jgi:hypothetical protein
MAASAIFGKMGKARGEAKVAETNALQSQDQNRLKARGIAQGALIASDATLTDRAALDLDQRKFGEGARGGRFNDAMRGGLAANAQDVVANRPKGIPNVSFSGGIRPSAFGPQGREAGQELSRQALLRLMEGDKFEKLPSPTVLPELGMSELPKASGFDKFLGIVGPLLDGVAAYKSMGGQFGRDDDGEAGGSGMTPPSLAGVTPFVKPPTARFFDPYAEDEYGDRSNR